MVTLNFDRIFGDKVKVLIDSYSDEGNELGHLTLRSYPNAVEIFLESYAGNGTHIALTDSQVDQLIAWLKAHRDDKMVEFAKAQYEQAIA